MKRIIPLLVCCLLLPPIIGRLDMKQRRDYRKPIPSYWMWRATR